MRVRHLILGALVLGCSHSQPAPTPVAPPPAPVAQPAPPPPPKPMPAGLDEAAMDTSVSPCDDFYQYACGNWVNHTEIPAERPEWMRSFDGIQERNEATLRDLLDQIASGKEPEGTVYGKQLADFWTTCMDVPGLERSLPELQKELAPIAKMKTPRDVVAEVAALHAMGVDPLFRFESAQDMHDATKVIGQFDQGGLGLPDRDYYLKDDAKTKALRDAYQQHVRAMFGLLGDSPQLAQQKATQVMQLETALAKASLDRVSRREPKNLDHRTDLKGLKAIAPTFDWHLFLDKLGAKDAKALNVTHPPFFTEVARLVKSTPIDTWRTYLAWNVVRSATPALPQRFQDEAFKFRQALMGAKQDLPRWKKCVRYTDGALGFALARPYVVKAFGGDSKEKSDEMVSAIERAFRADFDHVAWMDAETRQKAIEKLEKIARKIGVPDEWRKYDGLETDRSSFLHDAIATDAFEVRRDLKKIGKPLDRNEWEMTPPTVNAYYEPAMNEIVFPAGILQPPFFDAKATAPVNFGAIGMVIGHEHTHGFDDEGRHYDELGNLTDWWTKASDAAFTQRAACVKEQFDHYVAIDDVHMNGALTLGENIADLGGVKLAYAALQSYLKDHPDQAGQGTRFSPEQQFFLGYAQSWCGKYRPQYARLLATVDPHSPPFLRVNGPLSNLPAFQKAFACPANAKMVRSPRCEIW